METGDKIGINNEKFNSIKEAYELLGTQNPVELSQLYDVEDQKLMKSGNWDYDNQDLITNKIKNILEKVDINTLTKEEREWTQEILWFWYHHAISCALWKKKDKEKAREYAKKALEFQDENHPNKLTKLLYLLVNNRFEEATIWSRTITTNPEKETAGDLLKEYKEGYTFEI